MASPRYSLRVVGDEWIGASTRALDVERTDGAPWSSVRGKYVILDTGLVSPEGRAIKRAYSLTPLEGDAMRCRMVVKRIGRGLGSGALHEAAMGAEYTFSGPWGKLVPDQGLDASTLFVATDTGITSALGAATRGVSGLLTVAWLRAQGDPFFDVERARAMITAAGARFVTAVIPDMGAADRAERTWAHVDALVSEHAPRLILAAGDGDIVFPLKSRAFPGESVREVRIECFFHNPERKSA